MRVYGKLAGWTMFAVGFLAAGIASGAAALGGGAEAYMIATAATAAGAINGAISTYAANPNAGIHEYAFSVGLGTGKGVGCRFR